MKIKVCGLTDVQQMMHLSDGKMMVNSESMGIQEATIQPGKSHAMDFIGINFYTTSPRYYRGVSLATLNTNRTKKVGIFVNEDADTVIKTIHYHGLHYAQLHGDETPAYCTLIAAHAKVIKAFPHYNLTNVEAMQKYTMCELFLFDTASLNYGGSGKKFDWSVLHDYRGPKPYLLAGGIESTDIDKLKELDQKNGFLGIDINSKFEKSPGIKDLNKINSFIKSIRYV
jgi:phosphoribosylanthranilate isomerase